MQPTTLPHCSEGGKTSFGYYAAWEPPTWSYLPELRGTRCLSLQLSSVSRSRRGSEVVISSELSLCFGSLLNTCLVLVRSSRSDFYTIVAYRITADEGDVNQNFSMYIACFKKCGQIWTFIPHFSLSLYRFFSNFFGISFAVVPSFFWLVHIF